MLRSLAFFFIVAVVASCSLFQPTSDSSEKEEAEYSDEAHGELKVETTFPGSEKENDTLPERPLYHPSETKVHDLIHTKLDVRFDWENRYLKGKATIDLTPHFYSTDSLTLDAKGMDIHKVKWVSDTGKRALEYDYDARRLRIDLDTTLTRKDTFRVFIDYTAKPEELDAEGSQAITSAQGLYFIDPDSTDPAKPTQAWTQGETESSSCWFPTIDAPNQKMTQEISITVKKGFKTLSNGTLEYSLQNGDGTRTDHWKQDLPHTPYLVMMAVGDFAVVEDEWKGIPVNYWVEKEYRDDAMAVFGNTPEMLEFYSDVLGVEYPWAKYDQVVVRDFVSGAMENTTATVHGSMMRKTKRELIDSDNEPTIAHELIHHWFGDLVTCESWANLPLNEAFATYGEYMWEEYKYGRDAADKLLQNKLDVYLRQAQSKKVDMIRYDYNNKESMFDAYSYHKGGRILHMLRKVLGDDAFYESLELYLERHAYKPAEIHDLRIAFEDKTGKDLNWFFNEWFLATGHPVLDIRYAYDSATTTQKVMIEQEQDFEQMPVYKMPLKVDLYYGEETVRKSITIDEVKDTFSFKVPEKPDLVNVDAQKMLLCEKVDHKTTDQYIHQFYHAPLYLDRYEAISHCAIKDDSLAAKVMLDALNDPYYYIRLNALQDLDKAVEFYPEQAYEKIRGLAMDDPDSKVRATATKKLNDQFPEKDHTKAYERALEDSSYLNISVGIKMMAEEDPEKGMQLAQKHENSESSQVLTAIGNVYSEYGGPDQNDFFLNASDKISGLGKMGFVRTYSKYIQKQDAKTLEEGMEVFKSTATGGGLWYAQVAAVQSVMGIKNEYKKGLMETKAQIKDIKENAVNEKGEKRELNKKEKGRIEELQGRKNEYQQKLQVVKDALDWMKENIENERVLRYVGG